MWSCGVVLYVLLCGRPPFSGARTEAVFRQILDDGVPEMTNEPWPSIGEAAKDAVRSMMAYFPGRRPGARETLSHEYFRAAGRPPAAGGDGGSSGSSISSGGEFQQRRASPALGPCRGVGQGEQECPDAEVLQRLRGFAAMPQLKRAAAKVRRDVRVCCLV